jgi:repressor LexA
MAMDSAYLSKLQDYYAKHQVIPSYSALGKLWGISAKSWVSSCVTRLKEEGYLKLTPDRRLRPVRAFTSAKLAHAPVRAGLPKCGARRMGSDLVTNRRLPRQVPSRDDARPRQRRFDESGLRHSRRRPDRRRAAVRNANVGDIVIADHRTTSFTIKFLEGLSAAQVVLRPRQTRLLERYGPRRKLDEIFGVNGRARAPRRSLSFIFPADSPSSRIFRRLSRTFPRTARFSRRRNLTHLQPALPVSGFRACAAERFSRYMFGKPARWARSRELRRMMISLRRSRRDQQARTIVPAYTEGLAHRTSTTVGISGRDGRLALRAIVIARRAQAA